MDLRRRLHAGVARQLGHPTGLAGRVVGAGLNRGNRRAVTGTVEALAIPPGGVAADVGFGGGVGLALLLDRIDPPGRVHGVEISSEMLGRAARRFREAISAGRLELHQASMLDLPFAAGSLDGIITTNTIYFVPDLVPAFGALARALKGSGRVAVGLADPAAMEKMPHTPYGFRIRPVEEIVEALGRAELTLAEHRRVGDRSRPFHVLVAVPTA